jgi:hypothetical protein
VALEARPAGTPNRGRPKLSLATDYLKERGITAETIEENGIEIDTEPRDHRVKERLHYASINGNSIARTVRELIWIRCRDANGDIVSYVCRLIPEIEGRKFLYPVGVESFPFVPAPVWQAKKKANKPIIITEGPVKALAILQAGGLPIGLGGVWNGTVPLEEKKVDSPFELCRALRSFDLRERNVELAFDTDATTNRDVRQALLRLYLALYREGAIVRVLSWPLAEGKGIDDFLAKRCGTDINRQREELAHLVDSAILFHEPLKPENLSVVGKELKRANLTDLQLDQLCRSFASPLKVTASKLFADIRPKSNAVTADRGFELSDDIDPWPDAVDGQELLNQLTKTIRRHVVLNSASAELAVALWIVLTYVEEYVDCLPMLIVMSPLKRCGKSTLLALLNRLVRKPLGLASTSSAALYRIMEKWRPTLLIDEAELLLKDNEDLRLILNSGHTRDMAWAIRVNPDTLEPERFQTWAPKALASIGKLSDTIMDRSIVIPIQRRPKDTEIAKLRDADVEALTHLRQQLWRWRLDHGGNLRSLRPALPNKLNDRAGDNWFPLLTISEKLGDNVLKEATAAALVLSGIEDDDQEALITYVLLRLRTLFEPDKNNPDDGFRSTIEIVDFLNAGEEVPWSGWEKWPKGMTREKLARLLKRFGIKSERPYRDIESVDSESGERQIENKQVSGYWFKDFERAFLTY